ncbi:MAG: hypothetical protein EOO01_03675, partial [Chitinophagaceae bacterium]
IISSGKGAKVAHGDFLEMHIARFYRTGRIDSIIHDTRGSLPATEVFDTASLPRPFYNIISQMSIGDSVIIRILSDSMFKADPAGMPPFIKKGHYLVTTIKLLNIYKNEAQADSARQVAMTKALEIQNKKDEEQVKIDEQKLQDYFKKNNISPKKSPLGMYVEIQQEGTGNVLDTSTVAEVNYTGRTLDGKVFDSNTDPSFKHPEPLYVNLTNDPSLGQGVITGWKDGLLMMKKGSRGKFYVPSNLAYGSRGAGNDIPPYSVLIFDIEVTDVLNREQAKARMEEDMKKRREAMQLQQIQSQVQKQMKDQIRNSEKLDSSK